MLILISGHRLSSWVIGNKELRNFEESTGKIVIKFLVFLSAPIFIFLLGCNRADPEAQSKTISLTNVADYTNRELIEKSLDYAGYNENLSCSIRIDDDTPYCVKIDQVVHSIENSKSFIYVMENGSQLHNEKEKESLHGIIKFFKFEILDHKFDDKDVMTNNRFITNNLKLVAESNLIKIGRCGDSCSGFVYRVGNKEDLAWVVKTSEMHQGAVIEGIDIFGIIDEKIQPILQTQTYYSDAGYYPPDSGSENLISELSANIETIPDSTQRFFDIKVIVSGNKIIRNKEEKISVNKTIRFDSQKRRYDMNEIDKIFYHEY